MMKMFIQKEQDNLIYLKNQEKKESLTNPNKKREKNLENTKNKSPQDRKRKEKK